jgi:hypothetical protein
MLSQSENLRVLPTTRTESFLDAVDGWPTVWGEICSIDGG